MTSAVKVLALVGSYRKGGIIDSSVDQILLGAREAGAVTEKIYLVDKRLEYCTNCRACSQQPGTLRGKCIIEDDLEDILTRVEAADALVLGSPMNFGTVTAVTKTFVERLVCFAYWPWGQGGPAIRNKIKSKRAVVVASSAAPGLLARISSRMVKLLKDAAGLLGAKTIGVLFIGFAAMENHQTLGAKTREKARLLGERLAAGRAG